LLESEWTFTPTIEEAFGPHAIRDDELRMMFSCVNPRLAEEAQVALALPERLRRQRGGPRGDGGQVQLPAGLADLGVDDFGGRRAHDATPQPQPSNAS